MENTQSNFTW